jgi:hypothetical protein
MCVGGLCDHDHGTFIEVNPCARLSFVWHGKGSREERACLFPVALA